MTIALLAIVAAAVSTAEQLPVKTYTTADGLAHNHINHIRSDSRGFLWICTDEGLSRFDGYHFTSYTRAHGLPHYYVNDLIETKSGTYWIATDGGVCRLNPARSGNAKPLFNVYRPGQSEDARHVNTLLEGQDGKIWCGSSDGLYRLEQVGNEVKLEWVEIGLPREALNDMMINALVLDRNGALWVGAGSGLYRRAPDGQTRRYTTAHGLPENFVGSLLEDNQGRLWGGTRNRGLFLVVSDPDAHAAVVKRVYSTTEGLPQHDVRSVFQSSDGKLWIGTSGGLSEFDPARSGAAQFRNYASAHGLSESAVFQIAEDRDRNLWLGTYRGGVMKIARHGMTLYGAGDGFRGGHSRVAFETQSGQFCVASGQWPNHIVDCFDGRRFAPCRNPFERVAGPGWPRAIRQTREGEWWVATSSHVLRFRNASQAAAYTIGKDLPGIVDIYEDSRGDVWMTDNHIPNRGVARWQRSTGTLRIFADLDRLGLAMKGRPTTFAEDVAANIWMGFWKGGLVRYDGVRFRAFTSADGMPDGSINALHRDSHGRLWVASSLGGVARIDHPAADRPGVVSYKTGDGLSSNEALSIAEDRWGRIYIGTNRGVDRLDADAPGKPACCEHYTTADGLPQGAIEGALRDRRDALWFVSSQGVSRLVPALDAPLSQPSMLITGLRISGAPYPVSVLGETRLEKLDLARGQNQLEIDFMALDFRPGARLRYQYALDGADPNWSHPTEEHTIHYASLPPGAYRFSVRPVTAEGAAGPPATLAFTIRGPVWQRWWFLSLVAALVAALIYVGHRYHLARLLELERVRTRIATDLHDDLGANLSRIAILSEVVKRHVGLMSSDSGRILTEIAETSRGLVDGMSDIVWAIDPRRDDLRSVIWRIRQFASDVLESQGIRWTFEPSQEMQNLRLSPEQRRHVFLIFKEAINNAARHAGCRAVRLTIEVAGNECVAAIHDDGCGLGFEPQCGRDSGEPSGNGLPNMRARATALRGTLEVISNPGDGTRLTLRFPLKRFPSVASGTP